MLVLAQALNAQSYDLLVKGRRVIDPKNGIDGRMDVAIGNGRIARVAANIPVDQVRRTIDADGLIVTPGLIDIHFHVYQRPENKALERDSSVQPDAHTFRSGVTTVVDAGTSGWKTIPDFKARVIDKAQTRVLAMLNISGAGDGHLQARRSGGVGSCCPAKMAKANPGVIVGFKSAHLGGPAWESIDAALKASRETSVPVMVDFGYLNQIRSLPTLLMDKLRAGDIYTHCFSGHGEELLENGRVNPNDVLRPQARCHLRRGLRRWQLLLVRGRACDAAGLPP